MTKTTLEADYLIIGSGAVGMAFADTLLTETENETIIIVDRYAKAGGHWNVAYPFVTLHQPSQFYGVSSKELSKGRKDKVGLNKGLYDLATGAEVSAYFDEVMRHTFLPTGRVQYFPLCDYKGNYQFESLVTGEQYEVKVNKKLVDATYLKTSVPATHTPSFSIADEVTFLPINDLLNIKSIPKGFVIIGGGKTGIDACLWLLENGVHPDKITWIVSRDAWLIDRRNAQPTEAFFEDSMGAQANQMEAIANAESIEDLFDRLEKGGVLLRIDSSIRPKMFHGATVSQLELEQLRRIKNVVRLGRVKHIGDDEITLDKGSIPTSLEHLHVDCSASAITNTATKIIFEENLITPQTVRPYQPVFSASVIAYVEANYPDNKSKNNLCQVVPLPNHDTDWIPM
ncbi:MAG: NAD(P)/FAD-dependent oxidoreductase, partial [Bacteroidota bacterium]